MRTKFQRALRVLMLLGFVAVALGAAAGAGSAEIVETQPVAGAKAVCFLLPVEPGEAASRQWCARTIPGTPLDVILQDAPEPFRGIGATSVTLGWDYDSWYSSGDSLEWYGANTCAPGRSYIGNTPSWFVNRASSAVIASGSGCWTFRHYDNANQSGTYGDCTTNEPCNDTRMVILGMDNKTESVLFFA